MPITKEKKISVPSGLGNATPATVLKGITFTSDSGINQTGEAEAGSAEPVLQEKTVTENGAVTADEGFDGLSKVNVNVPIPDGYVIPTGEVSITTNGEHDVSGKAKAIVNVPVPDGYIQPSGSKTITENGTFDVTDKASVTVAVESGADLTEIDELIGEGV